MPKLRTYPRRREYPPIDWLWAAILERKVVMGYDLKRMAEVANVSYGYMRRLINTPTRRWPYGALLHICDAFGIEVTPSADGRTLEGVYR